jgi:zinc transport system permease protein
MTTFFQYDFMVRALVGAVITGATAPAIGTYLVQRRLSLIGDGLGHVALTGVGVGLLLNRSPVLLAVVVAVLGAIAIELIRERGKTSGDVALALLFYGGISGGVVLVSLSPDHSNANLTSYLFGAPMSTSRTDLVVIAVLSALVLAVAIGLRPWLFAVCHDEEYARVAGLPVRLLNLVIAVTAAITVTVAMRAVGLLLVSALMVVPVATAQQLTRGFATTLRLAIGIGLASALAGLGASWQLGTAPGATTVLMAILAFLAVSVIASAVRRARRGSALSSTAAPPPRGTSVEPPDVVLET